MGEEFVSTAAVAASALSVASTDSLESLTCESLLLLLLLTRFLLTAFSLHTSLFANWVFQLSDLPVRPFNNLIPAVHYQGLLLDMNTLAAMFSYLVLVKLLTSFLRSLFLPPQRNF